VVPRQPLVVGAAEGSRVALRVLVTGAGGQLGTDLVRGAGRHEVIAATSSMLDVGDRDMALAAITSTAPDLVIHAAAWTAVDACEADPERAFRVNAFGCRNVAEGARLAGAHLVAVSTDYVFDGNKKEPYTEWDATGPLSVYGRSKLAGEHEIRGLLPTAAIVRTAWVCGANGSNMVKTILRLSQGDGMLRFVDDQHGCPTFTEDLAATLLQLGAGRRPGTFHVTNQGSTTWYQFARDTLTAAGRDPDRVRPIRTEEMDPPRAAPRPINSVLDNAVLRMSGLPLLADHHEPLERTVKALLDR
jgi:dTDP-4-dehydrorhamnose reductase